MRKVNSASRATLSARHTRVTLTDWQLREPAPGARASCPNDRCRVARRNRCSAEKGGQGAQRKGGRALFASACGMSLRSSGGIGERRCTPAAEAASAATAAGRCSARGWPVSPSATPDKSLRRSTQQHAASLRRSWSLARARGAGRPVGRRRLTGTSRSCQCHTHAPVLQLLQMVYRGAYSRHGKAELLRYSRT